MQQYKRNFLKHLLACQEWLARTGVKGHIDPLTLDFVLEIGGKPVSLFAQFVGRTSEGRYFYTRQFNDDALGFVGWMPYLRKQWTLATDKLEFKEFAEFNAVSTPRYTRDSAGLDVPFIIKPARSSFGLGIRGPFLPSDLGSPETALRNDGEFYEQFVLGRVARGWYWNDALVVLELFDMPRVTGDGKHTIRELVQHRLGADKEVPDLLPLTRIQGRSSEDILPVDHSVVVDFRYVSPLTPTLTKNCNVLRDVWGTPLHQVLVAAGRTFWKGIPKEMRPNTIFVLDAVIDRRGKPYFLEMNCNAQVHPDVYPAMLEGVAAQARTSDGIRADAGSGAS